MQSPAQSSLVPKALAILLRLATSLPIPGDEDPPPAEPWPRSWDNPQSQADLEAWSQAEAAADARIQRAVEHFLRHSALPKRRMPYPDSHLLRIRIGYARYWLLAAPPGMEWNSPPEELLRHLLLDGWLSSYLESHY